MFKISYSVKCPHTEHEILSFIDAILSIPKSVRGCVIEAGCFKGGSTAKFSLAAKLAKRKLIVFDSFEGIPPNKESHDENIFGGEASFKAGDYCGTLDEVKKNVAKFGEIKVCSFVKGWFDNTMPNFSEPVTAAYIDVDLASSTRTCLKHLYPLTVPGGVLFSQDGHLPLVIGVFKDEKFWQKELGTKKPRIAGLGKKKLIRLVKPR